MRVKRLAQEHNTMPLARAQTLTARSGDERTNREATAPPIVIVIVILSNTVQAIILYLLKFLSLLYLRERSILRTNIYLYSCNEGFT